MTLTFSQSSAIPKPQKGGRRHLGVSPFIKIFDRITAITRARTCLPVEPTTTARETGMENTWAQTTEAIQDP